MLWVWLVRVGVCYSLVYIGAQFFFLTTILARTCKSRSFAALANIILYVKCFVFLAYVLSGISVSMSLSKRGALCTM